MPNPPFRTAPLLRLFLYLLIQAVFLVLYALALQKASMGRLGSIDLEGLLRENRWLEWFQISLLCVVALMCVGAFRAGEPALHRLLALLALFAVARELDSFLEKLLFDRAHWIPMGLAVAAIVAVAAPARGELAHDLPLFFGRPGFYLMLFGFALVVLYAQVLGQREIWEAFQPKYESEAKRFVEEGLEFMGYVVIGCGVLEERFFGAPAPRE